MIEMKYEDRKCVCCKKVYVNSLFMDTGNADDKYFIICPDCANNVYNFMGGLKKNKSSS